MAIRHQISLFFREGSSDKRYDAFLEEVDGGCVVNFAFGRRGSALKPGTKTNSPVGYEAAKKIFDKLVAEKMAKGYTQGEDGAAFSMTDKAERVSGLACQLLNPVDEAEALALAADPDWMMQEKMDGERRMVRKDAAGAAGVNRKGLVVPLTKPLETAALDLPAAEFVVDGEAVGDVIHAFDLLSLDGEDLRALPYERRFARLAKLLKGAKAQKAFPLVKSAADAAGKTRLLAALKAEGREGVVFKRKDAPYVAGRPASGGAQRKFKFYATASLIVAAVNAKRSVALEALDGAKRVEVGNVTIPANADIPKAGDVCEIRYLYAYPGGSLYQPVYLGRRGDIDIEDCVLDQLKYKAAG